jgi:hypothetical protein
MAEDPALLLPARRLSVSQPAALRWRSRATSHLQRRHRQVRIKRGARFVGLGMCLAFGYLVFVYRMFRGKVRREA